MSTLGDGPLGVVVVSHDLPVDALDRCLAALVDDDGTERVLCVHNGDRDAPVPTYGGAVEVIRTVNRGYGAAADLGLFRLIAAGCRAVALVNDDVVVTPDWLAPLVDTLDRDAGLGAVQPTLVFAGTEPPVVNSTGVVIGPDGAGVDRDLGEPDRPGLGGGAVDVVTGGAALFRPAFLDDLGGFDHRYVMYYEDVDLCLRGRERGWRFGHVGASRVLHAHGSSSGSDLRGDGRTHRTVYFQERNRLWCAIRFGAPSVVVRALWLSVRRLRHEPRAVHRRAFLAGVAATPRLLRERRRARIRNASTPPCAPA